MKAYKMFLRVICYRKLHSTQHIITIFLLHFSDIVSNILFNDLQMYRLVQISIPNTTKRNLLQNYYSILFIDLVELRHEWKWWVNSWQWSLFMNLADYMLFFILRSYLRVNIRQNRFLICNKILSNILDSCSTFFLWKLVTQYIGNTLI